MRGWQITGMLFSIVFLAGITTSAGTLPPGGELLYRTHCIKCHGTDGSKGKAGKNNLQLSIISIDAIQQQISEGKKGMPSFKKKLTPDEITAVADYALSLRK